MVVAEGVQPRQGQRAVLAPAEIGHAGRLGGMGEHVAAELGGSTQKDARVVVLGHLLSGKRAYRRWWWRWLPNVNYVSLEEVAGRVTAQPLRA